MAVEKLTSGSEPGFDDYDQVIARRKELIVETLDMIALANMERRHDHAALPYTNEAANKTPRFIGMAGDLAQNLYDERDFKAGKLALQRSLFLGYALLEQVTTPPNKPFIDTVRLRDFCRFGDYQDTKLYATTDRYRRVRPELNSIVGRYVPQLCEGKFRDSSTAVANLVVWQSEDYAYENFKLPELKPGGAALKEITTADDLLALWNVSPGQ